MQPIPKIIHQIWSDIRKPLPKIFQSFASTWQNYHLEWQYELWDEERMEKFMKTYYPQHLATYHNFPYHIQRWDAIRYLILYTIGGVYIDCDIECLKPVDDILAGRQCCIALEPEEHASVVRKSCYLSNAFMATVSKHPFMKQVISTLFNNNSIYQKYSTLNNSNMVLITTGPVMLTNQYEGTSKNSTF